MSNNRSNKNGRFLKNLNNSETHRVCEKCNTLKELNTDNFYKNGKDKLSYSCKICLADYKKKKYKPNSQSTEEEVFKRREKAKFFYHKKDRKAKVRITSYKNADKKKGLETNLSLSFVENALKQPCFYCGFSSTGLDRIDNTKGHSDDNCLPCCTECNTARGDKFSVEEMKIIGQAIKLVKLNRI